MKRLNNTIYFDSDEDFLGFVSPKLVIREGKHCKYTDLAFSDEYQNELDKGTRFCIKDENSVIYKRKAVNERMETKNVENLDPWCGFEK